MAKRTMGRERKEEWARNSDAREYDCEICGKVILVGLMYLDGPIFCGPCRLAIQRIANQDRIAKVRAWIEEHGMPEGYEPEPGDDYIFPRTYLYGT